ncbi:MAG TPA: hypothetical protein V6C81_10415 [Planktothrix sp.]
MIDRMYVKTTIEHLEAEKAVHDTKFSDNPAHKNCLPNFELAIERLKQELAKLEENAGA